MIVIKGDNGKVEIGRGAGVTREALSLLWMEFSIAASTEAPEKNSPIRILKTILVAEKII